MRPTIIPGKKNPAARPDPSLQFTSAETLMNLTNLNSDTGTATKHVQAILAPLVAVIDPLKSAQILGQVGGFDILAVQFKPADEHLPPASGEEFVDEDFIGTIAEYYGAVHDNPSGGFFLDGMLVCKRHHILQGTKTNPNAAENFDRWRLAGIDGKPRSGNRSAPSIVHCIDTDTLLLVPGGKRKPRRLTFFELCKVLDKHRRDLDEAAV